MDVSKSYPMPARLYFFGGGMDFYFVFWVYAI